MEVQRWKVELGKVGGRVMRKEEERRRRERGRKVEGIYTLGGRE